jgi:hypothetical protein
MRRLFVSFSVPIFFYYNAFIVLTYPVVFKFSTHLFADGGDGLQFYWNLWWVHKALIQLHQNPWFTDYLHYPYGTTLIGHSLNIFNGLMGIILLNFLTLTQTYNFIIIFSFVIGGLTMFLLSFYLNKNYFGSLIAGYIFTFSSYHLAHLIGGQMDLVSQEWIPLFVLCWYLFMQKQTVIRAILTSSVLFLVISCNYYYFFYCFLVGFFMFLWFGLKEKQKGMFLKTGNLMSLVFFFVITSLSSGILIVGLIYENIIDPFLKVHSPSEFSLDLFAVFIPGGHWFLANLTSSYWLSLPGNITESDVFLGWSVIIMLIYVWIRRDKFNSKLIRFYFEMIFLFFVLSLGPILHIWGKEIIFIHMPYALLQKFLPILSISGVPVRMIVIVVFFASLIFAVGIGDMIKIKGKTRILGIFLVLLLIVEYSPKSITLTKVNVPAYIAVLKNQPNPGGVLEIDSVLASQSLPLYFQTIHEKPIAFGYISRIPSSVQKKDDDLEKLIQQGNWRRIYINYQIRYVIFTKEDVQCHLKILKPSGSDIKLYDFEPCL